MKARLLAMTILLSVSAPVWAQERVEFPLSAQDPAGGADVSIQGARPMHLVFFASWCPPCMAELGPLAELEARWSDRGYRLVIVAVNTRQSPARLLRVIQESQPPGTLVFDADGSLQRRFGVEDLPTHVLVDAGGTIRHRATGFGDELRRTVERLSREAQEN